MNILAEYNGERVRLVNIRENGTCDIIKTIYDEKTETDNGKLLLVNKKDLKIVDKDFLIDSLQEHIRQANVQAEKKTAEELTAHEKEVLKSLTTDLNYKGKYKKDVI